MAKATAIRVLVVSAALVIADAADSDNLAVQLGVGDDFVVKDSGDIELLRVDGTTGVVSASTVAIDGGTIEGVSLDGAPNEGDLYYDGMLVQADKLRRDVVKKLSKPIGGMSLETYNKKVLEYRDIISQGWRDFVRFKLNVRKWRRPKRVQRASTQPRPATRADVSSSQQVSKPEESQPPS